MLESRRSLSPASLACMTLALATALCRDANGTSFLSPALELALECAAALAWLYTRRQIRDAQASTNSGTEIRVFLLIALAAGGLAFSISQPRIIGLAVTAYIAGFHLFDWLARYFAQANAFIDAPRPLFSLTLKYWLILIVIAAILLALPAASASGVPDYRHNFWSHVLDSLFAAVSAACLHGVTVQSFGEDYTLFGQSILLLVTQLSGMAFTLLGLSIARPFLWRNITARTVLLVSLVLQIAAVAVMHSSWHNADAPTFTARVGWGLAYSASAIWNSGLSLRPDGLAAYFFDFRIPITLTTLAIVGSLGLPFLIDLILPAPQLNRQESEGPQAKKLRKCSTRDESETHKAEGRETRIKKLPELEALAATTLLGLGAVLLWYFDHPASRTASWAPARALEYVEDRTSLGDLPSGQRWSVSLLVSATLRSTGLQSIPVSAGSISWWTFGLMLSWMTIGGSSGGVASGVRTTVVTLPWIVWRFTRQWGQSEPTLKICYALIRHILVFALASTGVMAVAVLLLLAVTDGTAYEVVFEAVSALTNGGLSTGLSLHLTPVGRLVMIGLFIVGRLVPVYFWLSMSNTVRKLCTYRPNQTA